MELGSENLRKLYLLKPALEAARSKASVYGRSPAETMASNPARCKGQRMSSRSVKNGEAMKRVGPERRKKKNEYLQIRRNAKR